jgi:hypothetical protein
MSKLIFANILILPQKYSIIKRSMGIVYKKKKGLKTITILRSIRQTPTADRVTKSITNVYRTYICLTSHPMLIYTHQNYISIIIRLYVIVPRTDGNIIVIEVFNRIMYVFKHESLASIYYCTPCRRLRR